MKAYVGHVDEAGMNHVLVSEFSFTRPLNPHNEIINHSPDGFNWGYEGSGPAQLAFAILYDMVGEDIAKLLYQKFKREIISQFENREPFSLLDAEVQSWLNTLTSEDRGEKA